MEKLKILVPTDFSDCADNALDYALELARALDGEITLLNSLIHIDSGFLGEKDRAEINVARHNKAKRKLLEARKKISATLPENTGKTYLLQGPAEQVIEEVVKTEEPDFIVMGTEGASGLKAFLIGSFTASVIDMGLCPVIAVPAHSTFQGINSIFCATELHESEYPSIDTLIDLAAKLNAGITFMNIDSQEEKQAPRLEKLKSHIAGKSISTSFLMSNSTEVIDTLDLYIEKVNPDLVVTLGKKRDFFDRLLGKQVSRHISLNTHRPFLSFPKSQ